MAKGDTKTNQYLDIAANGTRADFPASCCETRSQTLIREVGERIMDVEDEVERLENNPDVADIVATYADLQSYDTSQLTDKDVIRVLQDETHDGDSTYYRWSTSTNTWTYIGESKQYTDFVGTDGTTAGTAGLVPAPATTDAGKFLKADGTWDTAGGSITPVQTTGTSTTDVMSQNAVTSMVYADPATQYKIKIGAGTSTSEGEDGIEIGHNAAATKLNSTALGVSASASGNRSIAIGGGSIAESNDSIAVGGAGVRTGSASGVAIGDTATVDSNKPGAIALGAYSSPTATGEMNIGSSDTRYGYNNTNYRVITGVHDGIDEHSAATVGQITPLSDTTAPTTATVGTLGKIYIDTSTATAYMCVAVDDVTPSYTWKKITA